MTGRQSMRRDAEANHARLLTEADALIAERGLAISWHELARRAGVGVATVYRHFPTHADLLLGLYDRLVDRLVEVESAVSAAPTAWEAITAYVDGILAVCTESPATPAIMREVRRIAPENRRGDRFRESMARLVERGHEEGVLRDDIAGTDLAMTPLMLTAYLRYPEPARSVIIARQRRIVLDGLCAHGTATLDGAPLTVEEHRIVAHSSRDAL